MISTTRLYVGSIRITILLLVLLSGITGCDNNANTNNLNLPTKMDRESYRAVTLTGLVNNDEASIKNGRVEVTDKNGAVVTSYLLNDNARYKVDIPASAVYPIVLTAYPEQAKSEDEQLRVVVVNPAPKYFDITTLTTAIAEKALTMGGYTSKNLMQAALTGVAVPDKDRTMGGFSGDPTKQFGGWH